MMRILHHLLFLCFLLNLGASSAQYSPGPESPTSPPYYSLPEDEVSALQNLLMDLGSAETVDSSFCSLIDTSVGPLQVDLLFPSNSNACHIQNISRSSSSYSRRSSLGASSVTYLSPESAYASINPSVANLTFLQKLDLSNMGLQSSIPESLGELSKLQYLDLSYNQLTGGMTMIDKVQSLSYLDLSYNLLEGKIPNLTNLVDLTTLILRFNKLEGNIPDALGNQILKLEYLGLNENQLEGKLPDALGNLRNLRLFDVGSNNITGTIPESFHQLTSLEYFGVYGNNMSGPIRPFFTNWKNLRKLVLTGNNFEGPLPPEIFTMGNLYVLSVTDLVGGKSTPLPKTANFTSMIGLILRNCSLACQSPPDFKGFKGLDYVDMSFNNLTGPFCNLDMSLKSPPLTYSVFSSNSFNETCGKHNKRTSFFINSGGGETKLDGRQYDRDNFTDNYYFNDSTSWGYRCQGDPTSNDEHQYLKNLSCGVGFSDTTLHATARVCPVSLKYRLCLRNGKYNVTLHFAEIEYVKNEDYSSLRKRIFDVKIQDYYVRDLNIVNKAGGPAKDFRLSHHPVRVENNTLEIHLYWAGKGTMVDVSDLNGVLISAISVTPVVKPRLNSLEIAFIALACVVFLGFLILTLAWQQGWIGNKELYEKRIDIRGKKFTVKQLIKATQNFSRRNELGAGGFGAVYKAELAGQVIAVKKLNPRSRQGILEFRRELYSLKSLRHPNFVELLDGYSGHGFHLLIYEYMENKSLADVLFDPNLKHKLNWEARYKICKDMAKGLKYLHEESHLNMIHGDIKASNILLDGELNAKISDFGLAKIYIEDDQATVVKVGGTTGYMAPEYAAQGILSPKVDVYSFGVVLLEIISGRKNAEYKPSEESEFLLDSAYVLQKRGKSMNLVDEDLRYDLSEEESHQAKSALLLAMMCVSLSPSLRPTISEAVSVLEGERTIEQVSDDHAAASSSRSIGSTSERLAPRKWSSTDHTPGSTDISSAATTTYFVIKEKDGKKDQSPGS